MADLCVVHLVRAANGVEPFRRFGHAYAQRPAGVAHDLVCVFKGFTGAEAPAEYREAAGALQFQTLFMRDWGFDLKAYGLAAREFPHPYFCFLNSFSEPRAEGWLAKLSEPVRQPGVGIVGATGSWESMYSNLLRPEARGPAPKLAARLWHPLRVALCRHFFAPFPNWHLRTNAFVISRELMLRLWPAARLAKRGAYLFENGKHSLTRQVLGLNLDVLIAGRSGDVYTKEAWARSRTFRQANQENLLVMDNQTRLYAQAGFAERQRLSQLAWGPEAAPAPPPASEADH